MSAEVKVPSLGVAIQEVTIAALHKHVGDPVKKGEVIAEVVSEKVSFEIVAAEDGYIIELNAGEGDKVEVGSVLAVIGTHKELGGAEKIPAGESPQKQVEVKKAPDVLTYVTPAKKAKVAAAPAAKALLKEYNLDPATIKGSGPDGMITKNDVLQVLEKARQEKKAAPGDGVPGGDLMEERVPLTPMRMAIADNMVFSKKVAAHVTTVAEVDMTEVLDLRKKLVAGLGEEYGKRISVVSFVCRAMVEGIKEFPVINSSLEDNFIILKKYVNIGVAVAVENGLVVPVIKGADKKSFLELDSELNELTLQARAGKLRAEQLQGGTISLSNAGTFGAVIATPIINQPQSAIVWMGKVVNRPVVVEDEIAIRSMMYLCVSYDHRVLDGAVAARFLQRVRRELENPLALLVK